MTLPSTICRSCGRALADPKSIAIGLGPKCATMWANQVDAFGNEDWPDKDPLPHDSTYWVFTIDGGEPRTNVPRVAIKHSPTGFAWGYAGSGPADLALNLLCMVVPVGNKYGKYKIPNTGHLVSRAADYLYQRFKDKFIATLPAEGGKLEKRAVKQWVFSNLPDMAQVNELYQ